VNATGTSVPAPIPTTFVAYLRSFGPGIITVLTWLSAGDIVGAAMSGGTYGYSLMWAFALCLLIRALFISAIARYQLCNIHGESVVDGLCRLHPWVAPLLFALTLLLAHAIGVFLQVGAIQACGYLFGTPATSLWTIGWCAILTGATLLAVFVRSFRSLEFVFFMLAGLLTITLVGLATLTLPSWSNVLAGLFIPTIPEASGAYSPRLVIAAMVGAVGGGLGNLIYTSFAREKGWVSPSYRRVQQYDLYFGLLVLIVLDLSVWILGAETFRGQTTTMSDVQSLAGIIGRTLGAIGYQLFYLGLLGAIFSSMVGNAFAYASLASDAYSIWRRTPRASSPRLRPEFRWFALWIVLSPLVWLCFGASNFISLTLLVNSAQVVLIPVLVVGIWVLNSQPALLADAHRNRPLDHALAAVLLLFSAASAWFSLEGIAELWKHWNS
jgi:Mn2+/Fe2+ NRAMP family transporter